MTAWQPRRVLSSADVTVDNPEFTPIELPPWLDVLADAAIRRREARLIDRADDGIALVLDGTLRVILSTSIHDPDGRLWAHLSASRAGRMPSWPDLIHARDVLLGPEVEAYQVAPPASRYVNRHPRVLHLWAPLAGPVLPRFDALASDGDLTI